MNTPAPSPEIDQNYATLQAVAQPHVLQRVQVGGNLVFTPSELEACFADVSDEQASSSTYGIDLQRTLAAKILHRVIDPTECAHIFFDMDREPGDVDSQALALGALRVAASSRNNLLSTAFKRAEEEKLIWDVDGRQIGKKPNPTYDLFFRHSRYKYQSIGAGKSNHAAYHDALTGSVARVLDIEDEDELSPLPQTSGLLPTQAMQRIAQQHGKKYDLRRVGVTDAIPAQRLAFEHLLLVSKRTQPTRARRVKQR